jgi:hypothetical protein
MGRRDSIVDSEKIFWAAGKNRLDYKADCLMISGMLPKRQGEGAGKKWQK